MPTSESHNFFLNHIILTKPMPSLKADKVNPRQYKREVNLKVLGKFNLQ